MEKHDLKGNKRENENSWKQPSREKCAESGMVCNGLSAGSANRQRVYTESETSWKLCIFGYALKSHFFKIESDYYMIKGVQGKDYFRIAVHGKHAEELEKLEIFLG